MKYSLTVKSGSIKDEIIRTGPASYLVRAKARPERGLANKAAIKLLARELGVPRRAIIIKTGQTSRHKVVEILTKR